MGLRSELRGPLPWPSSDTYLDAAEYSCSLGPGPLKGVPGKSACGLIERTGLFRKH